MNRWALLGIFAVFVTIPFHHAQATKGFEVSDYLMGNRVVMGAEESRDSGFSVVGADLDIRGKVKERLRAFGANVILTGEVEGETMVAGANVALGGKYGAKVRAGAANLTLSGTFESHVVAAAAKITVTPTAVVKGDLIYTAAVLDLQKGSQIRGKVAQREFKERKEWVEKGKKVLFSFWVAYWFLSIPALVIVGVLIHYFFPRGTDAVISTISQSPWKNIGVGLVFVVVVPVGAVLALITLVGIPAGIIGALLYGILVYTSRVFIGVWIGRKILGYFKKSLATAFFWPLVLGTLITTFLLVIPVLGWFFRLFFAFMGVGAIWLAVWKLIQRQRSETLRESPGEKI
jgi:cytoskeletal protein CcmA (bactofilin family)